MRVLVVYASRHGATQGIAERIAATLGQRGLEVTLRRADEAGDPSTYDAFVIGAAAYAFHWLKDATQFVRRHGDLLAGRPVWIFSSGPLGTEQVDAQGRDVRTGAAPREFPEIREAIHPRGERIFFGAYDPDAKPIGLMEHFMGVVPAAREVLKPGDFREWDAIEAWAGEIAEALSPVPAGA